MTRILEVEENGTLTLPPDVLGNVSPRTRYIVESVGERLTLRPDQPKATNKASKPRSPRKTWEEEQQELAEEISKVWPEGLSVTEVFDEMRR